MMIEGIIAMEKVLVKAADEELGCEIPTEDQFTTLKAILPLLQEVKEVSEKMSSDKYCTMDRALAVMYNLSNQISHLKSQLLDGPVENYYSAVQEQLKARFPDWGSRFDAYAIGHLLHPFYKGIVLKKCGLYETYVDAMIDKHITTIRYWNQARDESLEAEKSAELIVASGQSDAPSIEKEVVEEMKNKKLSEQLPPMRMEWLNFQNVKEPSTVNLRYLFD